MMTFNKWLNSANIFWRGRFVIIFINGLTSPYIYPFPDVAGSSRRLFLSYTHTPSSICSERIIYSLMCMGWFLPGETAKSTTHFFSCDFFEEGLFFFAKACGPLQKCRYPVFRTLCKKRNDCDFSDVFYCLILCEYYVSVFDVPAFACKKLFWYFASQ